MTDMDRDTEPFRFGRRGFLRHVASVALGGAATLVAGTENASAGLADMIGIRHLNILNTHTSARLAIPYLAEGKVLPAALGPVRELLHDHHDGSYHDIDPKLLDLLYALLRLIAGNANPTIHVTSGYRSPRTNAMLRMLYDGVAANSYHMSGQAIDFWVPGLPLPDLHQAALSLRGGGVGYYPSHHFIHLDSGPVRRWGGGSSVGPEPSQTVSLSGLPGVRIRGPVQVALNGRVYRLTPIQARNLQMRRRALALDHRRRHVFHSQGVSRIRR